MGYNSPRPEKNRAMPSSIVPLCKTETMTSLIMADITGRQHKDIMRAIRTMESSWHKVSRRNFTLMSYEDSLGRQQPMYQLTKSESLYVAAKFNDLARAKLVLRWEELELAQLSMTPHALYNELASLKEKVKKIEERNNPNHFTIMGYASYIGVRLTVAQAKAIGRRASQLCRQNKIAIDTTPDPRFGRVNLYPVEVLKKVLKS